jgi:hypothetical protein
MVAFRSAKERFRIVPFPTPKTPLPHDAYDFKWK